MGMAAALTIGTVLLILLIVVPSEDNGGKEG